MGKYSQHITDKNPVIYNEFLHINEKNWKDLENSEYFYKHFE